MEMLSLRENRALEERLPNKKVGLKCIKKCMKPATHFHGMSCNLAGSGHAYGEVNNAVHATYCGVSKCM